MNFIIKHKNQFIVIVLNIIGVILCQLLLGLWHKNYNNYDTSNIKEYQFKIIETKVLSDDDGLETKITFKDANNIKYSVYTTGDVRSKYSVGDDITVYSEDERNYELSESAVIDQGVGGFFYLLGTSAIAMAVIITSGVLCGFKWSIFSLFFILLLALV